MAVKKIEIIYDINGKAIDVAVQSTLNLQQQVKALTAELRKTKEGTAEFSLLSTKLGDAQDGLAKTTAKSKDLFSSLSLLPGPVGQFFGQLQGGIELLKTFSSFTFKDLAFQFKETANDIGDIGKNLSGIDNSAIEETKQSTEELNHTLKDTAAQGGVTSAAVKNLSKDFSSLDVNFINTKLNSRDLRDALVNLRKSGFDAQIDTLTDLNGKVTDSVISVRDLDGEVKLLTVNQIKAASTTKGMIVGLDELVTTEKVATFWTSTLGKTIQGVLIGTGVGIAIVLIGELVAMIYKLVTSEEEAETATRSLTAAFEEQQRVLQNDLDAIDASNKAMQTRAKIAGKTEQELNQIVQQGGKERLDALRNFDEQLYKDQQDVTKNTVMKAEDKEKLLKDINDKILKNGQDITKQILSNEQVRLDQSLAIAEKQREKQKAHLEKIKQDNKTADESLLTLKQENSVLYLKNERDKQYKELQNQADNEARKIESLEISETKKEELRLQIYKKYGAKMIQLADKFNQEDEKKLKENYDKQLEWDKKLGDMEIQSIADQTEREKAEKQKKYDDDLISIKKALDDKLITQKEYDNAVIYLTNTLNNDLKKIQDDKIKKENDDKLKKLDDDIKFLQISTDAEKNSFTAYWNDRQKILDKSKERELSELDLTEAQKVAIEKKYVQLSKDLQKEKFNAYVGYVSAGLNAVSGFYSQQQTINQLAMDNELAKVKGNAEEEDKIKEKYFYKNRDAQKGQAIIATLQSAIQAYSSLAGIPVVGPFLGAAAAAAALIFGYKQVDLIASQTYQSSLTTSSTAPKPEMANYGRNYGDGGMIDGPRHAQGGTLINAEGGEAVMTRGAVTMFQPLLSAMNQMGGGTAFSKGAAGQANYDNPKVSTPAMTQPQIIKTYVVSNELTSEAQKQAKLKNLSTL
jgi:hypothetical protein